MLFMRDLLDDEDVPIGTFVKIPAVETLEILKLAGFDFVIIDFEHAPLTLADVNHMVLVARSIDLVPIVRVPDHGYGDVQRILDAGAAGILIPHVSTAEQCRTVMRQALHPPYGTRGAGGGMRAGDWGMTATGRASYASNGRDKVVRIPMIEEKDAVPNAEEILAVDGVDAVFIGPGDLSMTMGARMTDEPVQQAIETVFQVAKKRGVPVGSVAGDAAGARRLVDRGYDFVLVSNDTGMLGRTASTLISEIRA
jgi:2-keto-3-deoxy-L-rhamnonate aldolase RhmA